MDVSAALRSGALTSTDVTETLLARIARHDGALKSYTTLLADRALAGASAFVMGHFKRLAQFIPHRVKALGFNVRNPPRGGHGFVEVPEITLKPVL